MALGPASIADLFAPEERGSAFASYALGSLFGPVIGPVAAADFNMADVIKYLR